MAVLKKYGIVFFAVVLLIHCLFILLGLNELRILTKVLLIPLLFLYLFTNTDQKGILHVLIDAGLILSFIGDAILTQTGAFYFLAGMLAFIGTHVCNGIVFYKLQRKQPGSLQTAWISAFILSVFSAALFIFLQPQLGSFAVPVIVYMIIISAMSSLAAATVRNPFLKSIGNTCFIPGAFLFVLSDALLAVNKFYWNQSAMDVLVMLTYGTAQYLLVKGFVKMQSIKMD